MNYSNLTVKMNWMIQKNLNWNWQNCWMKMIGTMNLNSVSYYLMKTQSCCWRMIAKNLKTTGTMNYWNSTANLKMRTENWNCSIVNWMMMILTNYWKN